MKTTTTTERKKPVRRTALQQCEAFRLQLLKVQVLCMQEGEKDLAEACDEMGTTMRDALLMRVSDPESATDFQTTTTGA